MIASLLRKLLYSPRRHAHRLQGRCLQLGDGSLLLQEARFDFRRGDARFAGRIEVGRHSMLACRFVFESDQGQVRIGDHSFINGGTRLICRESIEIGSHVTIAWGCTLYDHNSHSLDWRERAADLEQQFRDLQAGRGFIEGKDWATVKSRPIVLEDKCWLGFDVTVLNGVRIGEGAVVSARSVVRSNVPTWTIVAGNPAVPVGSVRRE